MLWDLAMGLPRDVDTDRDTAPVECIRVRNTAAGNPQRNIGSADFQLERAGLGCDNPASGTHVQPPYSVFHFRKTDTYQRNNACLWPHSR